MTHFHANIIEDGATREAMTLDAGTGPFVTREDAQRRLLRESGQIAGQGGAWALVNAAVGTGSGIDVVEFYNSRSGIRLTLSAWECSCREGERAVRAS